MTLIFGIGVDLDQDYAGIVGNVGQGRRSKVKCTWLCPSVCLSVCAPLFEPFDLGPPFISS